MASNTLEILRNVRELVGSEAFEAAVASLASGAPVAAKKGKGKEKKPRNTDPAKTAERSANMAAMQEHKRRFQATMPEGTTHQEAQKAAGAVWKAMSPEEKTAWKEKNMPTPTLVVPSDEKECVVTAVQAEPKQTVVAVKDGAKKSVARPKKETA